MSQGIPMKESAMNRARVESLGADLARVNPGFDAEGFTDSVMAVLPGLELKARIACVADALAAFLPSDIGVATEWIVAALPAHDDATFTGSDFGIYTYAPYSDFLARYGCTREHLGSSLEALGELTKHFTAEDAVRYFLNAFPDETMAAVARWSRDPDYHVRRLASEATRPVLPWSPRLRMAADSALPILDTLCTDGSRFVATSVANHLNDLSRTHPDTVLATLRRWHNTDAAHAPQIAFIVRHSLRTLIKKGHPGAFEFFGASATPAVEVSGLRVDTGAVAVGESLGFGCVLTATGPGSERVILDYVLTYPRARGEGEVVFKWLTLDLAPGEPRALARAQPLRPTASRKLVPGPARLHIQVNGTRLASAAFEILPTGR